MGRTMRTAILALTGAILLGPMAVSALAQNIPLAAQPQGTLWDQKEALRAARSIDTRQTVERLLALSLAGDAQAARAALLRTASRTDWPAPVRDKVFFDLIRAMRDLPPRSIPAEVMNVLTRHQPLVVIEHPDHPYGQQPLYGTRAAATGLQNQWRRIDASREAEALLLANPGALADAFTQEPHAAVRRGYLDALDSASEAQRTEVLAPALERLRAQPRNPALTELAGRAALLNEDLSALTVIGRYGAGAALAPLLRQAALTLPLDDAGTLLLQTLKSDNPTAAALAIAELGPGLVNQPAPRAALLAQLNDAQLGAGSALILAMHGSPDTLAQLREAAASDSTGALRAQQALSHRQASAGEAQR